ncbi:MAG: M15 family metallopeptidase, partial [Angustibacter sp.]
MPTSQNGYPANDPTVLTTVSVPGSNVRFRVRRGPVAQVLTYLAARIDDEVEDIDEAGSYRKDPAPKLAGAGPSEVFDDWSYAERPIRGSATTLSNHASGTAIDINATQHPLGVRGTWTADQIAAVRRILDRLRDPVTGRCV